MTAAGDLDSASNAYASVYVQDGLTLDNATVYLGTAGTTLRPSQLFRHADPGRHGHRDLRQECQQHHQRVLGGTLPLAQTSRCGAAAELKRLAP